MDNIFNLITKTEYNRLINSGMPHEYAMLIACEKGNQMELCDDIIKQMQQDQQILMEETLSNLIPLEKIELVTTDALVFGLEQQQQLNNEFIELKEIEKTCEDNENNRDT